MRVAVRGLEFDVHQGGPAGGPTALLLHGFPQHSAEWELVAWRLHAAGVATVALDQRGYSPGARPAEVSAYGIGECVADAWAVLDALAVDSAHVVGHDWGALVGWRLAAQRPERVRSLTAVSVPHPRAMVEATAGEAGADQRARSSYIQLFRQPGRAEELLLADGGARLRSMFAGVPPDRVDTYLRPMLDPAALTAALNWYRVMSADDLSGVPPVSVPTTYVWSDQDMAIGRLAAQRCVAHVTGEYRLVELRGVSHWIPDEAPSALADAVLSRIGA